MSRSRSFSALVTILIILLALALLGGMLWGNSLHARTNRGEIEFFVPWLAARTYLDFGDSPYSDPAAQRAQIVYYGRLADEGENSLHLWVPFPVELFYLPFSLLADYGLARGLWMTLSEVALIAAALLALHLTGWRVATYFLPLVLLFTLLWAFGMLDLLASSAVPFLLLALIGSLLYLRSGQDELAGILLLFPLFMPRLFGILIVFLFWWVLVQRRWRVLAGSAMALGVLLLLSFLLLPGWFMPALRGLTLHMVHDASLSTFRSLGDLWPVFGPRLAGLLTAILAILLLAEWNLTRRAGPRHLLWTASLTLAATPLLGIPFSGIGFSMLVLPAFCIFSMMAERWQAPRLGGPALIALLVTALLSWLLLLVVPSAAFQLISGLLFVMLYWVKWWAVRPPKNRLDPIA